MTSMKKSTDIRPGRASVLALSLALGLGAAHAAGQAEAPTARSGDGITAFVGATLWDGSGAAAIPDAVLLVEAGRVTALGAATDMPVPDTARRVDLQGRWVVPGLINAHGHVGMAKGLQTGEHTHTRENIQDQLELYARYGVTSVVSLDEPGYLGVEFTRTQDQPELDRARLFVSGKYMDPESTGEVDAQVRERVEAGVEWAKIRVDDQLGRTGKMDPPTYSEVIRQSRRAGLPLTAHLVYLEDARGLVDAGADVLGHSVRDAPVDAALVSAMRERDVCLHPTLTREVSTFVYAERPDFFDDAFFLRDADADVLQALQQPHKQAEFTGREADWYREALPVASANMLALHEAGVRIAFGTDSGPPARFQGYFEHMELGMMQDAGMSPEDVLVSATRIAAECMRIDDVGVLRPGAWADFLVLRADPLQDIRHLRQIEQVRIAGNPVDGARFDGR